VRIQVAIDTWDLIGGSERYAGAVTAELCRRGHEVRVLCGESASADFDLRRPVEVTAVPGFSAQRPTRAQKDELRAAIASFRPDVLYLLTCRSARTFAALLPLAPLVRFVQDHTLFCPGSNKLREDGSLCTRPLGLACLESYLMSDGCTGYKPAVHPAPWVDSIKLLGRKLEELELAKQARRLVVASRYMQSELMRAGLPADRIACLPYFTEPRVPAPLPPDTERFLSASDRALIVIPARLTLPDKGVDFLLTALAELERPFRAVVAGSGPAREWLELKSADEGLAEHVHFSGWLPAGAMATLYACSRAVVCPSVWNEPFGLVGLEAMAAAKPVIAFAVGGIPEWLSDGETGFLIPRKDTHALARAIERLIADPALAHRLGAAGHARRERDFSVELHMRALERILEQAAD
jgi:glycosyltransferase involved in cell wall biosynthesis